jgi:acyl carrier protein
VNRPEKFIKAQEDAMSDVSELVKQHIERLLREDGVAAKVSEHSLLDRDLNLTSLKKISLLTDLCSELNVDIYALSDVDLAKMKSVGDITAMFVAKKPAAVLR